MNDDIKEISDKLDEMRQEYRRDRYEHTSYIFWGFTLAMVGLTVAFFHPVNVVAVILFFIMGWIMWFRARRVTLGQNAGNQMIVGNRRLWIRLARWFEWLFAMVLMTTITVIVSLEYLSGFNRVALLVLLGIFFVATLISQFDQAGWFGRRGGE